MARFALCPTCNGAGVQALHGLDVTDAVHEDPEFAEDYAAGRYDTACQECNGRRVVDGCREEECSAPALPGYGSCFEHLDDEARAEFLRSVEDARAQAAEMRAGA